MCGTEKWSKQKSERDKDGENEHRIKLYVFGRGEMAAEMAEIAVGNALRQ